MRSMALAEEFEGMRGEDGWTSFLPSFAWTTRGRNKSSYNKEVKEKRREDTRRKEDSVSQPHLKNQ